MRPFLQPQCTPKKLPLLRIIAASLTLIAGLGPKPAFTCTELAAGTSFWVRLSDPVSSYTAKPGMPVRGFVLESPECDGAAVLAVKTPVEGHVVSAHRVGLGLWHETAALEIQLDRILPAGSAPIEISGRVQLVDNARETVKRGVIHGIRSTETPQGRISSRIKYLPSWHLYPDPFLLGYKMIFPVFPEPEIYLRPGADIEVQLSRKAALPADLVPVEPLPADREAQEYSQALDKFPERTLTGKGKEADVINMLFAGSREQVEGGFAAAGWQQSKSVSKRTVAHQMYAFLAQTNYADAPMSKQFLAGHAPDLTLEKTFDSYEKRDHLRIWDVGSSPEGEQLWASAAVHETGATLSVRHKGFMHHVSEKLDDEQHAVVRDLVAADCVESVGSVARPEMDHVLMNATGEVFRTDGNVTVVRFKTCSGDSGKASLGGSAPYKPGSKVFRYVRKEILTVRSDAWRANVIYTMFDLTRMTVLALKRSSQHRAAVQSFRQENHPLLISAEPTP